MTRRTLANIIALLALSALPLAGPPNSVEAAATVKPQPLPIQTVQFNTWQLPAYVDITPVLGGLSYDVFMTSGACTQQSVNANTPRVAYQVVSYTQEIDQYGTYCFYVNAWDANYNYMTATILTTVKVVQIAAPATAQTNTSTSVTQFNQAMLVHN